MTRAERIERAAQALIDYQHTGAPDFVDWEPRYEALEYALALPPDPAPRRLTVDDIVAMEEHTERAHAIGADANQAEFLNARIFGETK